MRASKKANSQTAKTSVNYCSFREIHISGAEGIYDEKDITKIVKEFTLRALTHQKGRPDTIVISAEAIKQAPQKIQSLPVSTLKCGSHLQARSLIQKLLKTSGLSDKAINTAFALTEGPDTMRGAAFVLAVSGRRVDKDMERGIRASRLGISNSANMLLARRLTKHGINNTTVKEALILASKVAASPQVMAELCISDDPDYTTGYVSSGKYGYVRIPHIKKKGKKKGGRVFFLKEDADIDSVTGFLEKTPVIINSVSPCFGTGTLNEIIDRFDS